MRVRVGEAVGGPLLVVFESGERVMEGLRSLAEARDIAAASLSGIGAFRSATIAYFDWASKAYEEIAVDENVEVAPLSGTLGRDDAGNVIVHAHCALGRRDGSALAGHLVEAVVRPTLELVIRPDLPDFVRRRDPESGLLLIRD